MEPLFAPNPPSGWEFYPDEQGGSLIAPCHSAVLHVHAEPVQDPGQLPNLSRMLAGFLTLHHQPVATDELLPIKISQSLGFAYQYAEGSRAVRVWIVGNEKAWAFVNFQVPFDRELEYRETVDTWLRNFQFCGLKQHG